MARGHKISEATPGSLFGRWTILFRWYDAPAKHGPLAQFMCRCACGTEKPVLWISIASGKSLGCISCRPASKTTPSERFDKHYIPEPNSGCWLWTGSIDRKGYGQIRDTVSNSLRIATHVSLEIAGRPLRVGEWALHKCDVPGCVNPDHIFSGTAKDNSQDAMRKGRLNFSGLELGRKRFA